MGKRQFLSIHQKTCILMFMAAGLTFAPITTRAEQISVTMQQTGNLKGKVTDSNGQPIVGATIMVKGTTQGTVTDMDGNYTLNNVPADATIVVSFLGYDDEEVIVGNQTNIDVTLLENFEMLGDIVVVGYGTQKKSDITGSVTSINKDRLSKLPVANVLQAVQGAAAGVTIQQSSAIPGDAPSALIRGRNSINASTGPYIVVDGVPISKSDGTLNDINPNDIESMDILKDASATAIYGMNGANGVILITTKRGAEGKAKITYAGYIGVEGFTHNLEFCNGEQITQRYKDYCAQNTGETMYNDYVKNQNEAENQAAGIEIDWIDEVTRTGIIQDHNISINGGAESVKYFVSGDFMSQKGVVKGFDYKRYSIRTNLDMDVTDYLTVGTNIFVVSHNRDGGRANFVNAEAMSPYAKMYEADGSYCIYPMYSEQLWTNPLLNTTRPDERRQWNINLNGYADLNFGNIWSPLEGLKYKFSYGHAFIGARHDHYQGREQNDNNGYGYMYSSETQSYVAENILSYAKDFGLSHIDLTGVYAASRKKWQEHQSSASKFINDDLGSDNLDSGETQNASSEKTLYTTCSQMGRLNYSFDSRYLFTFTVRRDGSSVFSDGKKYGTFPSVALGWNVTNESFMENALDVLNNLKLRLSYGKAGNEAIGQYSTLSKVNSSMLAMDGNSLTALTTSSLMGNPDLTWETTKTFNVGVDFGFLNNRIQGNLDIYQSRTTDLLLSRNLTDMTGYSSTYANMGETRNKGVELTINTRNIAIDDFSWNTSIVYSWNKNEIVDLYGDKKDDLGNRWFIGQPISVIYDYTMVGIWQEDEIERGDHLNSDPNAQAGYVKLADLNGDHKITADDKKVQGQTAPKWIGGMTNTFTYKNWTLSVFIQTTQGLKRNNALLAMAGDEMGRRNTTTEIGYWTAENRSNEFRSLNKNSNQYGYGFYQDASYTRLKDVTLSYTFGKNVTDAMHIGSMQAYVSGRNLATWTDWTGWDPESTETQRGWSGWENSYPMTRSVVFGLNVTF